MREINLLSSNFELYQKFLGLQSEAFHLSHLVNRWRDFERISEEMNLIILEHYQELYLVFSRSIQTEAILCVCRLLDSKTNGYGLEKLETRLIGHVNKLKKKGVMLHAGYSHTDFIKRLQEEKRKADELSMRLRDRRDNFIAHNSTTKIHGIGVTQAPTIESVDQYLAKYKPNVNLQEVELASASIFNFFKLCNFAMLDTELMIKDVISPGDLRALLFALKELSVWKDLHQRDYESLVKVRKAMSGWSPFRPQN